MESRACSRRRARSSTARAAAPEATALASDPNVRAKAGTTLFAGNLAKEYGFTDVDGRRPEFSAALDERVAELVAGEAPLDEDGRFLVWARYCQIHQDPRRRDQAVKLAARLGLEGAGAGVEPH